MNDEKKIAQAILDAQKMREKSYNKETGEYGRDMEECFIISCRCHGLSKNLWALLSLADYCWNVIQLWAEDVLAGKNILEECEKENGMIENEQKAKPTN